MKYEEGFYHLVSESEPEPVLVHGYHCTDMGGEFVFGFNTHDGGNLVPLSGLTESTQIIPVSVSGSIKEGVGALKDLLKIQCADGNWNHDSYMHGMANGMKLALSLFEGGDPDFLEAPDVWLEDIPNTGNPISIEGDSNDN